MKASMEGKHPMTKVLTTFELTDCNKALAEAGYSGKIHLHDVCGGQYLSWDEDEAKKDDFDIRTWIPTYFGEHGYQVTFDDDRPAFRLA